MTSEQPSAAQPSPERPSSHPSPLLPWLLLADGKGQAPAAKRRWYANDSLVFWSLVVIAALALLFAGGLLWREKLREQKVWTLVSDEDFEHASLPGLAADWHAVTKPSWGPGSFEPLRLDGPNFSFADGGLHIDPKSEIVDLVSSTKIPGNVRVEWDYRSSVGMNLNCFVGDDRTSGFTFHIAAWGDATYMVMTKGGQYLLVDMFVADKPIEAGRTYHFAMERSDRHVSLAIDQRKVLDYMDLEEALPQSFGFDCFAGNPWTIDNIRIYHQPLPMKVSPLVVADRLYQTKNYVDAQRQYEEILATYPKGELARTARFWLAMCAIRTGDAPRGLAMLTDFEAQNPDHALVPFSLHERLKHARLAGDKPLEEQLRQALAHYPGSPIVCTVLRELGEDSLALVRPRKIAAPGDHQYPDDIVDRVIAAHREIMRWSKAYQTPWLNNPFIPDMCALLKRFGRFDYIIETFPPHSREYGETLADMGRYEAIKNDFPNNFNLQSRVVHDGISFADMQSGRKLNLDPSWGMFLQGKFPELLESAPKSNWAHAVMLATGHADQVLADIPASVREGSFDGSHRMYAWMATGHPEMVLEESTSTQMRATALISMNRFDEALTLAPAWIPGVYMAALHSRVEGDLERSRQLFEKLSTAEPDCMDDNRIFSQHVLPVMMASVDGGREAARRALEKDVEANRYSYRQQFWYIAQRALGKITDEQFLNQPYRNYSDDRLLLAKALEAELSGDPEAIISTYRACLDLPFNRHDRREIEEMYLGWRLQQLMPELPPR